MLLMVKIAILIANFTNLRINLDQSQDIVTGNAYVRS